MSPEDETEHGESEVKEKTTGAKTKAQRRKEKKAQAKEIKEPSVEPDESVSEEKGDPKSDKVTLTVDANAIAKDQVEDGEDESKTKKKKKKKGAAATVEKEDDKRAKGPSKKAIAAMKDALKELKEEEERKKREEEEKERQEEEAETLRLEKLRLEEERKERRKQREKERKVRLKQEGKLLTAKQKMDKQRAQATLEALKSQGIIVRGLQEGGQQKSGGGQRPNRSKKKAETKSENSATGEVEAPSEVQLEIVDGEASNKELVDIKESWDQSSEDDVKDTWDQDSQDEAQEEGTKPVTPVTDNNKKALPTEGEESPSETESSSEEEEEIDEKGLTDAEKKRRKAELRIQKRREDAEAKRSVDNLRAAVICVLGHVDTGKTKILDKLRRTNVQDGEAGGITQQIGATNVPIEAIKDHCVMVKEFVEFDLKLPGLLIIDTPGHESFSNLRSRGSSLCDMAVLVVDVMHGLEPQTIESINLLKARKTPFIVALNKVDRLYDWKSNPHKDIRDVLKIQSKNTTLEFETRCKEVILQFAQESLNAALFFENPDSRSYISMVPTSATAGDGMGNLMALLVQLCQGMLAKGLAFSEELHATVLEVKALPGLGTTIDVILVNGTLREGDTIIIAGTEGPVVTQIRSLLMPQPMKELRVKNAYVEYKEIQAAQGAKIAAKDLDKAIAGLNMLVAHHPDEVELCKEEVARDLRKALSSIKLQERGVYVQASTLGSLEALLEFLRTSKIPYAGIRIGPVVKRDVMKASTMLEHDSQYAVILAFDVKIERDAQDLADSAGVRIFQADIIYHLFDSFMAYRDELKQKKRDEFKDIAVFPCKIKILPQFIFNSRDPIVVGVMIEAGILKQGTPLCVPSKEFLSIGTVTSIEANHKPVETARKGQEVCIKIENTSGDAPKMFGRHFDETDVIVSKINRESIDACKEYFRDDLIKTDWQLIVELKKIFQIM